MEGWTAGPGEKKWGCRKRKEGGIQNAPEYNSSDPLPPANRSVAAHARLEGWRSLLSLTLFLFTAASSNPTILVVLTILRNVVRNVGEFSQGVESVDRGNQWEKNRAVQRANRSSLAPPKCVLVGASFEVYTGFIYRGATCGGVRSTARPQRYNASKAASRERDVSKISCRKMQDDRKTRQQNNKTSTGHGKIIRRHDCKTTTRKQDDMVQT